MTDNMDNENPTSGNGFLARLKRPSARYSLGGLLAIGFAVGIIFWGGFNTVMEWTNTEKFCISCHEMRDNVYAEYKETIHYNNRTGVRAVCADCHVPREWGPKMLRKIQASRELYGKLTGSINTKEKFETKRIELARREWKRMLSNNSLECRNCHSLQSMDKEKQATRAARQHERAAEEGTACITCHQGIAHQLPEDMTDEDYFN
jgi:cytochrome c-type protein NapC